MMKTASFKLIRHARGISLVEVLIAFAATVVFVAFTAPLSGDLVVRMRIAESVELMEAARESMLEQCRQQQQAELSDRVTGLPGVELPYVDTIAMEAQCSDRSAKLTVYFHDTGAPSEPVLELESRSLAMATRNWDCRIIEGDPRWAPQQCQHASVLPGK